MTARLLVDVAAEVPFLAAVVTALLLGAGPLILRSQLRGKVGRVSGFTCLVKELG